ncbi:MAG: NAD(P)H-hydrate dehydratase [Betaproteobacteria bacterium]
MIPVLTAEQMRRADRRTIDEVGLPGAVLMENAGAAVARVVAERYPRCRRVVVLCGRGNNGGDGFVVARRLGARAQALLLGTRDGVQGDALVHLSAFERSGGRLVVVADEAAWAREALPSVEQADVVVDAVLGTGLRAAPNGLPALAIAALLARHRAGVPVVAVDLPSGLSSDSGLCDWPSAHATLTVTFAVPKRCHVLPPACGQAGELLVADIGIPVAAVAASEPSLFLLEDGDAAAAFPLRRPGAHKGEFGHLLIVAGSVGKTGAAVLAAGGALRSGAGLVTVATPEPCVPLVAPARPEAMTEPLAATAAGGLSDGALERLLALAGERDAVVVGPGLGQDPKTRALVREFVRSCPVPLVLDADALNALAPSAGRDGALAALRREAPTILTPHPGEMARLVGRTTREVQAARPEITAALARETGAVVVLKGERTLVAEPAGRAAVCSHGNPGMATGGTGDVLAGVTGALLARHGALLSATAAVVVHGRAGDLAARERGQEGMTAGDLVEALPAAIEAVRRAGAGAAAASAAPGGAASAS